MTLSQPIPIFPYSHIRVHWNVFFNSLVHPVLFTENSNSRREFEFPVNLWSCFWRTAVKANLLIGYSLSNQWLGQHIYKKTVTHYMLTLSKCSFFLLIVIFRRTCFLNFLSPLFNRYHILWSGCITFRIKIVKPFESVLNFQYYRLKMALPRLRDNGTLHYDFYFSNFLLRDNYKKVIGRNPKSHSIRYAINYHYTMSLHPFYVNKPRWYYSIDNNITYITQKVYIQHI